MTLKKSGLGFFPRPLACSRLASYIFFMFCLFHFTYFTRSPFCHSAIELDPTVGDPRSPLSCEGVLLKPHPPMEGLIRPGASLSRFAPLGVSMGRPFEDSGNNEAPLQLTCKHGSVCWSLSLRAWELSFLFHLDGSPPPALIKKALCECGCEEARRTSHGSDWRAEVEEGCVSVCVCVFESSCIRKGSLFFHTCKT